jgi:hypothetical protein
MNKNSLLQVRLTETQKNKIEAEAKKQNVKVPEYVLEAIEFYASFDVHFLEHIYSTAEKMKLPMPTVIQQLLQAYISADCAIMELFGTGGKTYKRAFQYDENGLIRGIQHANLVYEQVKEEISILRTKLENAVKKGKPVLITKEDAALMAARL